MRPASLGLAVATLLALTTSSIEAQVVTGRVAVSGSGEPVSAALVELLDADSAQVGATLTGADGRYTLRTVYPGTYAVRVRRLGFATRTLAAVEIRGAHRLDIELSTQPVQLEGVVATARAVCADGPGVGPDTQRLWDLVVGALDVARLAQTLDTYRFDVLLYVRDRTLDGRHVLVDVIERSYESGAFVAMPLETLADQGYVEPHDGGLLSWYMPDPDVLVSDHFLETHCFRVVDSEDPELVGLGFDPTPQRRDRRADERNASYEELFGDRVVEVRGVLWVDRATGALREMEAEYVGIDDRDIDVLAGGHARFEQLANGLWIVRQWIMRLPNLRVDDGDLVPDSRAETGGYVVRAFLDESAGGQDEAVPALPATEGGDVVGRLVASDIAIAVSNAEVRLSGSSRAVPTDAEGRFTFRDVPPGDYVATWSSPDLAALGLPPTGVEVSVETGTVRTVELSGPSWADAAPFLCPRTDMEPGLGIVRVRGEGRTVGSDEIVSAGFRLISLVSPDPAVPFQQNAIPTNGVATFCGVPTDVPLHALVGDSVPPLRVEPGPDRLRVVGR